MSIESHLRQAEHNEKFAIDLGDWNTIPYRDWVITALFYAALHLIEAYLESEGYLPARSHMKREAYIERLKDLRSIKRDYYDLQFASEDARYELKIPSARELRDEHIPRLERIKKEIDRLLSSDLARSNAI